jgi:hypothetical protein
MQHRRPKDTDTIARKRRFEFLEPFVFELDFEGIENLVFELC